MTTVTISMPDSLKEFLDREVATRGYGNVSEYIRSLLRDAQAKESDARLYALLLEGMMSGEEIAVDEGFWRKLRADADKIRNEYRKSQKKKPRKIRK